MRGDTRARAGALGEIGVGFPGYASNRESDGNESMRALIGRAPFPDDDKSECLSIDIQSPGRKVPPMSGAFSRRVRLSAADGTPEVTLASIPDRVIAVLASVVLAVSLCPMPSWADEVEKAAADQDGPSAAIEGSAEGPSSAAAPEPAGSASDAESHAAAVEPEGEADASAVEGPSANPVSDPDPEAAPSADVPDASEPSAAAKPAGWGDDDDDWGGDDDEPGASTDVDISSVAVYDAAGEGVAPKAEFGATLKAYAYDSSKKLLTEGVIFQWQYSSHDTWGYKDIPGATGATFAIPEAGTAGGIDLSGMYVRVHASDESAWETQDSSGVGPLAPQGAAFLSRVEMHRGATKISGDVDAIINPGDTIGAVAFTGGSSAATASNGIAVDASKATYAWMLVDSSTATTGVSLGTSPSVAIPDDGSANGKFLRIVASAGANEVSFTMGPIMPKGSLRLARLDIEKPNGKSVVATGDTLTAQARLSGGVLPDETAMSYRWYVKRADSSEFEEIAGQTGKTLVVRSDWEGATLKVTATAGGYNEKSASAGPVIAADSAKAAVAALRDAGYVPAPVFGTDANMNAMVVSKLAELGFPDATVRVATCGSAKGGASVSADAGDSNGAISYYYEDPSRTPAGFGSPRVTFEVSSGATTETWTCSPKIRWDMDKVAADLEALAAKKLVASNLVGYEGGEADDETSSIDARGDLFLRLSLPSWTSVTWESTDESIVASDGAVTRLADEDRSADITAHLAFKLADASESAPTVDRTFHVTAKATASDSTDLDKVRAALGRVKLTYSQSGEIVDPTAVTADIQLPRKRDLKATGSGYSVSTTVKKVDANGAPLADEATDASGSATVNGYRLKVVRPIPGAGDAHYVLTVAVALNGTSDSLDIPLTVKETDPAELDAEVALMMQVQGEYAAHLAGGADAVDHVTGDLNAFKEASRCGATGLSWSRSDTSASGIVVTDIDSTHPSEQWNLFRSSRPGVIAHETLRLVHTPEYNAKVTVTSCLTSEKFGGYYERYKDAGIDATTLAKYRMLYRQPVSATFTVAGTTGQDDPNAGHAADIAVTVTGPSRAGADGSFVMEPWAMPTQVSLSTDGDKTAWDAFKPVLDEAGLTYDYAGGFLNSITSADGTRTLGTKQEQGGGWSYWQFLVNGKMAQTSIGNFLIDSSTTSLELRYVDASGKEKAPDVPIHPRDDLPSYDADWPAFASGKIGGATTDASTPSRAAKLAWSYAWRSGADFSGASDPLLVNGNAYIATKHTLRIVSGADGTVLKEAPMTASVGYFSRPVYAGGRIIVPADGGALSAYAADDLTCVWSLTGLAPDAQALSSVSVIGDYVVAGYTSLDAKWNGAAGTLVCVNARTGAVVWKKVDKADETPEGYYWAGAAASASDVVIGGESGSVKLLDGATGKELSSVSVGGAVRAGITKVPAADAAGQDAYLAVSRNDGTLHRIVRVGDSLEESGSVRFAATSTSTPTVSGGKAFVCGMDATGAGTLSVIDLATMQVERTVAIGAGAAQATPLVSSRGGETYVYFTVNCNPGGVYRYRVGDDRAYALYVPDADKRNYTTASVVADAQGSLYYTNDSGHLFKLVPADGFAVTFDSTGGSVIESPIVEAGGTVERPADPTREGYAFEGWFSDKACTTAWDFSQPVASDTRLFAKWSKTTGPDAPTPRIPDPEGAGTSDAPRSQGETRASSDPDALHARGGRVAPSHAPVSGALVKNKAKGSEKKGDGSTDGEALDASSAPSGTAGARGMDEGGAVLKSVAEPSGSSASPLPLVGLVVGMCGLIGSFWWFLVARRRSDAAEG